VSHDLRTPLASMQGYLETLLLRHGTLRPEEERSYLEVAAKHSERLGKLIHDLFQLTKLEAHELKPVRESFPVAELVQDVVQKFQLAADKHGIHLSTVHSDTGHGIPADEVANIFDRYYRVNRGERGDAGNTGLGLAITRHIVELHGGEIRVESDPVRGTAFTFELPLATTGAINSAAGSARG